MTTIAAVIYRAPHLKQMISSDRYGKYNCAAYALARLTNAATLGGVLVSGKTVRALSNEPIPNGSSPGLSISQIVTVSKKLRVPVIDKTGETWDDVIAYLDVVGPGRRISASIDYPAWPERCQDVSINFGHQVTLDALRRKDGVMQVLGSDPLCGALNWYNAGNVKAAMQAWATKTGLTGGRLRFAVTREIPLIAKVD